MVGCNRNCSTLLLEQWEKPPSICLCPRGAWLQHRLGSCRTSDGAVFLQAGLAFPLLVLWDVLWSADG